MLRAFLLSLTLATAGFFLACSEGSVDPVSSTGELSGAQGDCPLTDEIDNVFSHGGLNNAVTRQCNNIIRELEQGDTAGAIEKAFSLIDKILGHHADGETTGDDEAVAILLNALLELVGLEPIFPSSVDENTGGGTCDNDGCTIVNQSGLAGIQVPPQTDLGMCYISFGLREFDEFLFAGFDNYPFQFEFEIVCADEANGGVEPAQNGDEVIFDPAATVGVCFADPPLGPTTEEVPNENRQLAHLPDGEEEPDLLPVEVATFLSDEDCAEASVVEEEASLPFRALAKLEPISGFFVSPLLANPGRLGGTIAALSPIGPVDNRGDTTPTTTTLDVDNQNLVDGGNATATATVDPAPTGGDVRFVLNEGTEGEETVDKAVDDGEAEVTIQCDISGEFGGAFDFEIGDGVHTLQAFYLGDGEFGPSESSIEEISCEPFVIG